MRRSIGYLSMGLLGACLMGCTHSRMTYLPDGRMGYAISCHSWGHCLTKAGQLCRNKGYTVSYSDEVSGDLIAGCKATDAR